MAITTTLRQEIDALLSSNSIYNDLKDRWEYLFESYVGGETYRDGNHLTRYQLESEGEYQARLNATPLDNHCQSVVQVFNSFLFREEPERELGSLEGLPEVEAFQEDADHDGRSLDAFMKDVSTWSSVFGHSWILLAKANLGAATRAEEVAMGVRPYANLITPLMMLDWSYTRTPMGKYKLDYIKYLEEINGSVRVVKEWRPDFIKTTVVDVDEGIISEEYEEENQLGMIPAVCVYNKKSSLRGIGVSDLADIADAQRMIYNLNSELEQGIRLDNAPSLVKTPNTEAGTGAGAIIHMPEDLDPALKPYIIENSGASVESILKAKEHLVEQIDKMANTGAVRATESRVLSGVSRDTEFQLLNARLSEKADNMELAEEQMWTLFAYYQGYMWDGEIDYPDSFGIKDMDNDIRLMLESRKAITDPNLIKLFESEIAEAHFGDDVDEYLMGMEQDFVPHEMINPTTGESVMAETYEEHLELGEQGYVHQEDLN